jgi:myo-inositol catabolism protein IolC
MLAFDNRASFKSDLFGIAGTPSRPEAERTTDAKRLIFESFEEVAGPGPLADLRILVDEHFGAHIARSERESGYAVAMPVERSGQAEFDFEFGREFDRHIEDFEPTLPKSSRPQPL